MTIRSKSFDRIGGLVGNRIDAFKEHLINLERSPSTIESYVGAVKMFFQRYDEMTKENMVDFKQWQMELHQPKTAALRCVAMNVYCDFINKPECRVKGIRLPKKNCVENVISMKEYKHLLACLEADEKRKIYYMIKFLAGTGCRASELVKLEKECLQTGEFTMWTKGKIRRILIPRNLIKESREYFETVPSEFLFPNKYGKQMSTSGVGSQIKKYGLRYGIRDEVLHPHAFRHLFAIHFLKQNKNIALLSDLLGHESLNTTAIYLRLSAAEQKKQLDKTVNW